MILIFSVTIAYRSVFEEHGKYYLQAFLDDCMNYKMLEYDRIDISEGIDINKTNASKEFDIWNYWYI